MREKEAIALSLFIAAISISLVMILHKNKKEEEARYDVSNIYYGGGPSFHLICSKRIYYYHTAYDKTRLIH
jgi:hypothetical protein